MNKGRVEAFTDAVVAIILTIMVLEFHIPSSASWMAMLANWPYFFAYVVSFVFICASWYNHHYMLAVTRHFSKRSYWINNLWLFTMSLVPVTTGWVGEHLLVSAPEYFYYIVYGIWSVSYYWLSVQLERDARSKKTADGDRIHSMIAFHAIRQPWTIGLYLIGFVVIHYWPPFALLATFVFGLSMAFRTNRDADRLFS